jgi:cold shock protein
MYRCPPQGLIILTHEKDHVAGFFIGQNDEGTPYRLGSRGGERCFRPGYFFLTMKERICLLICSRYIITYNMNKGTVKFFNDVKGFGFIKEVNSDQEYFVHVSGLVDEIRENDEVSFDLQEGRKGLNAINVKRA